MLEYAVRPYQTPNSQGKIIIPSTPSATSERAVLTWGATGTIPKANPTGFNVVCCSEKLQELSREGEIIRIFGTNSDDYVDVFRANKLTHKKKSNDSHPCDSPLDQYLGQEFGLDDSGDMTIDLGWAGTDDTPENDCGVTWQLNNNTTAAGVSG